MDHTIVASGARSQGLMETVGLFVLNSSPICLQSPWYLNYVIITTVIKWCPCLQILIFEIFSISIRETELGSSCTPATSEVMLPFCSYVCQLHCGMIIIIWFEMFILHAVCFAKCLFCPYEDFVHSIGFNQFV